MTGAASQHRRPRRGVFAKRFPEVWEQIEALETPHTRPVAAAGQVVNIDLGGALLYPQPERAWLDSQMADFAATPDRLVFDNPAHCNLTPISLKLLDDLVRYVRDEKLVAEMAPQPVVDVGYLFVFGIGLGHHILDLLETTPARHVVLIEPVKEFLLHSFDAIDWRKVIARADRRNITLHFILAEDPEDICLQVEGLISRNGNVFLDGSFFFQHYPSWTFRQTMVLMKERLKAYYITSGYFEDEIEMIRNCHANLRRWDFRAIESVPVREQSFPVLIVGAGPSLDRDMPHLKALRERAIVVSCGTSIGILLKNGIRPDLHCEIERGELVHELLSKVHDEYGFDGITLVASTTVDPRVSSLFAKSWFFVRGGLSPACVLMPSVGILPFVDPLCCNGAFASIAAMGFRNIWLIGLDLGLKEEGRHHARDSVYYRPEHANLDEDYRRRFNRIVPGNFGGEVRTFWAFDSGRRMLANAQRHYRTALVNCSDGASIEGAQPKVAAAVVLPAPVMPRATVLARIEDRLRHVEAGQLLDAAELQPHIDGCDIFIDALNEMLDAWLETGNGFFELEDRLDAVTQEKMAELRGFHTMARGSVVAMLRLGAFFASRITGESERLAYRAHFAVCYRRHCASMAEAAKALLSSLDGPAPEAAEGEAETVRDAA